MCTAANLISKWKFVSHNVEEIYNPIQLSRSLQFTCADVSERKIICGTNKCGVLIYERKSLKHSFLFHINQCAESALLTHVLLHPNEQLAAASTSDGKVYVCTFSSDKPSKHILVHECDTVTCMKWLSGNSKKLLIGTESGRVFLCHVLSNQIFSRVNELTQCDSPITQIDAHESLLLISCHIKSLIYNIDRKSTTSIGKKTRNGLQGACFYQADKSGIVHGYCARPGLRLWKTDAEGQVLSTMNFKTSLPPLFNCDNELCSMDENFPSTFTNLYSFRDNTLLTKIDDQIILIDITLGVISHRYRFQDIKQLHALPNSNTLYILTHSGQLHRIEVLTIAEYIETLLDEDTMQKAVDLCCEHKETISNNEILLYRLWELTKGHDCAQKLLEHFKDEIRQFKERLHTKLSEFESPAVIETSAESILVYPEENGFTSTPDSPSSIPRRDSSVSLTSLTSLEKYGEQRGIVGRLRAVTIDKLPFNRSKETITSQNSLSSVTDILSLHSLSPSSHPTNTKISPRLTKELSSPADVVDNVKDGISKFAKSVVASIKEKTHSQVSSSKSLTQFNEDIKSISSHDTDHMDTTSAHSTELSDESGTHCFFIGDDAIIMDSIDEKETELLTFLELTLSTYTHMSNPHHVLQPAPLTQTLLVTWAKKLCCLLSLYQKSSSYQANDQERITLKSFTRKCPWKMNKEMTKKCSYLAHLCVVLESVGCVEEYDIVDTEEDYLTTDERLILNLRMVYKDITEQFIGVVYFLMTVEDLLAHLKQKIIMSKDEADTVWEYTTLYFLYEIRSEGAYWNSIISLTNNSISLYSPMIKTWIDNFSKARDWWIITYTLGRCGRLDDLMKLCSKLISTVPLYHIWRSVRLSLNDNKTTEEQNMRFLTRFIENVLHQIPHNRFNYIKAELSYKPLLDHVLKSIITRSFHLEPDRCMCAYPCHYTTQQKTYQGHPITDMLLEIFPNSAEVRQTYLITSDSRSVIDYLMKSGEVKAALQFLLLATDINPWKQILHKYTLSRSDWLDMTTLYISQLTQRVCFWCGIVLDKLTINHLVPYRQIAELMLKSLGSVETLQLLDDIENPDVLLLDSQFFTMCLQYNDRERREREMIPRVNETLENHVWKLNISSQLLEPEIEGLIRSERHIKNYSEDRSSKTYQRKIEQLWQLSSRVGGQRTLEHPNSYWGVGVDIKNSTCFGCNQRIECRIRPQELLIYQCGHVVHEACSSQSSNPAIPANTVCLLCHTAGR